MDNIDERILKFIEYFKDKKCKDIAVFDLNQNDNFRYVILLTNANQQANKKFALNFLNDMSIQDYPEGYNKGDWIVFDFDQIIIHSFSPLTREKYSLDKLYHSKKILINKQNKK